MIKARRLIEDDGNYFHDLKDAVEARIIELDPSRTFDEAKKNYVAPDVKKEAKADLSKFMDDMQNLDKAKERVQSNKIFAEDKEDTKKMDAKITLDNEGRKRKADGEKIKGNEAMKSGDTDEAINHYTLALKFDPQSAILLSNRAAAYIKRKDWKNTLIDSNNAITIDPAYLKAYYRRAKANLEMKNNKEAAKDYKFLNSKLPGDKDVQRDLESTLKLLTSADREEMEFIVVEDLPAIPKTPKETTADGAKGFKRIEIEEDSEEDEADEEATPAGGNNKEILNKLTFLERKKNEGAELVKISQYVEAVKVFEGTINSFSLDEFIYVDASIKQRAYMLRCGLWGNMGVANMQQDLPKRVITCCDEVIKIQEIAKKVGVEIEKVMMEKTYTRRALAYEKLDKLRLALQDFQMVKHYSPGNAGASAGIRRCTMGLGIDQSKEAPQVKKPTPKVAEKKPEPPIVLEEKKVEPALQKPAEKPIQEKKSPLTKSEPTPVDSKMSEKEGNMTSDFILKKYEEKKELGGRHFSAKKYDDAYKVWTEAINHIQEAHPKITTDPMGYDSKLTTVYSNLLSNRAIVCSMTKRYTIGRDDACKVILMDQFNLKAYYRRVLNLKGLAEELDQRLIEIKSHDLYFDLKQKQLEYWNQAISDCERIMRDDPANAATT